MLNRRAFLTRTLQGASLVALGNVVPSFVASTARAAAPGKDSVLVLIELTGGNDGLNTVIPYADDTYHKARPTLRFTKQQVVRVNDELGLHPAMRNLDRMIQAGELALLQGVGYPNPDRSHFESMDIWQSADVRRRTKTGWIGRSVPGLQAGAGIAAMHVGSRRLPLTLTGGGGGVVSVNNRQALKLQFAGSDPDEVKARRKTVIELAEASEKSDDLLEFVQRRQLETYTAIDKLEELLRTRGGQQNFFASFDGRRGYERNSLVEQLQLVARVISSGFGTRVFYVVLDGFDTHSQQAEA